MVQAIFLRHGAQRCCGAGTFNQDRDGLHDVDPAGAEVGCYRILAGESRKGLGEHRFPILAERRGRVHCTNSSRDGASTSSSSNEASTSSSLDGASTSSSSRGASSSFRRAVLRKRDRAQGEPILEVGVDGTVFPGAFARSPQDRPSTHFPNLKAVPSLKRMALGKKYLLPIVPMSWHNICSFIVMWKLRKLTCTAQAISLVQSVQRALKQAREKLTPFEIGEATPEQIAAEAERLHEEERRHWVNVQAKKAIKAMSELRKSEDAAAKYKRQWEKLRQEKGALEGLAAQVEFNLPLVKGDDLKDEVTTPLDGEVGTPDGEGHGAADDGLVRMMGS
ncbi:hypothetical protein Cgig2_010945 [Carnegiea gigantea]|uniref:Uncharacterized protein n=1 Tax=Carnegiea gigantea TaxID=171969 RepID=A0A9Q1K0Q1_9CARY|nr:hypothetical protein Cgig2_010945 [Carnegiea gigantea]